MPSESALLEIEETQIEMYAMMELAESMMVRYQNLSLQASKAEFLLRVIVILLALVTVLCLIAVFFATETFRRYVFFVCGIFSTVLWVSLYRGFHAHLTKIKHYGNLEREGILTLAARMRDAEKNETRYWSPLERTSYQARLSRLDVSDQKKSLFDFIFGA